MSVAEISIPGLKKTAPRRAAHGNSTGSTHNTFMKKQTKSTASTKSIASIPDAQLVAALNDLFGAGKWEIPDDAVSGKVAAQVQQLQSRVDHLTEELGRLSAVKNGTPIPRQRINAMGDAAESMSSTVSTKSTSAKERR